MYYGGAHQTTGKAGFSISQFSEKNTSPGNVPVESSSGKVFCEFKNLSQLFPGRRSSGVRNRTPSTEGRF
ncbi:hypothetical protein quinque_006688 [Culex quinquefasciatus]